MSTDVQTADQKGGLGFVLWISIIATIGGFLFGFDSGVINGTVKGLQEAFNSSTAGTGFSVASMLLGCAFGALLAGRFADIFGRKTILIIAAIFFIVSAWGSGIANSSGEFIIYRLIGGLAVGAASVITPAYISEIAPAHIRGRLATIQQVAIIVGLTVAFLSNYWLAGKAGSSTSEFLMGYSAWRWMFWIELLPAAFFLLALLTIPESPRFLVLKGKKEKAASVLTKLIGSGAEKKVEEIANSLESDHTPRFSDLLTKAKKVRPIVWVGIGLACFQQLVGINVVFYYGAVLWESVGFTESQALLTNVISGTVSIAAVFAALAIIDKVGRKPLLWIGSVGMAVTLGIMTIAFLNSGTAADGSVTLPGIFGPMAFLSAMAYVAFFNFSWGPVMWVMLGEMFPNQIRGSGLAIAGLFQWVTNFIITMSFPIFLASIGLAGAYGIYTFFAALSILFVMKMVHETKGVELEDMQG